MLKRQLVGGGGGGLKTEIDLLLSKSVSKFWCILD